MIAGAAVSATNSAASAVVSQMVIRLFMGTFNPAYNKMSRRKMRYIQKKYMLAYQTTESGDDPRAIIASIDPNSKLLMSPDGSRPANPFQDEPTFEESLQFNFHPVSGHQGRFVASHAMACIGMINDYQIQRRARIWVPGVSSPGHPNDYINLFLEESKAWMRQQMTLDAVHAEELARRDNYYTKLKNDNYFWCFPPEKEARSIHRVIDFIHSKVKNALELISREEKNKSLQSFFKELNDHSTNAFEFGKQFLAYLLHSGKKINGNILTDVSFDGRTYETGKLHNLLESATSVVLESYVADMNLTHERTSRLGEYKSVQQEQSSSNDANGNQALAVYNNSNNNNNSNSTPSTAPAKSDLSHKHANNNTLNSVPTSLEEAGGGQYLIEITEFEESTLKVTYVVEICDPNGVRWLIRKTFAEFDALNTIVYAENTGLPELLITLNFPSKLTTKLFRDQAELYTMCKALQQYLINLLYVLGSFTLSTQNAVCHFMEVKQLLLSGNNRHLRRGEAVPNVFVSLKKDFSELLVAKEESKSGTKHTQSMVEFRRIWGIEMALKVYEAYALLQRMCTVLGWTLEVNHFFISMFGNTLAFSKLPLRDIIMLQKDIMTKFLLICTELFDFACKVNADAKYKWHKNLQMCENQLKRLKFHIEKCLSLISCIDSEHLDYETQMRRLRDVHARFQPLMSRIDNSLGVIQHELNLPATHNRSLDNPNTGYNGTVNNTNHDFQSQTNNNDYSSNGANPNHNLQIQNGSGRPPSGALALPRGTDPTNNSHSPYHNSAALSVAGSKDSQPMNSMTNTTVNASMPAPPGSANNNTINNNANSVMPITPGGIFSRGQSPDTLPTNHTNPLGPVHDTTNNSTPYYNSSSASASIDTNGIAQQSYGQSGTTSVGVNNNPNGYTVEEVESDNEVDEMVTEQGQMVVREGHSSTVCVIC